MTKDQLLKIEERVELRRERAEAIMDGDENYDGADGARYVLELCDTFDDLIAELKKHIQPKENNDTSAT